MNRYELNIENRMCLIDISLHHTFKVVFGALITPTIEG